jgi:hypothetical protein
MAEREHAGTGAQGGDALGSASGGSRSILSALRDAERDPGSLRSGEAGYGYARKP